jgi:hypothetical protein
MKIRVGFNGTFTGLVYSAGKSPSLLMPLEEPQLLFTSLLQLN